MDLEPRPRRVVVLGVGAMGQRHARVFAAIPELFELAGVFDVDDGVAARAGASFGVPTFQDEAACVEAADLVVIASPIDAHAGAARRALARGRDVLVEKPLSARAAEADDLVRVAARRGARLFVGHSERFNPVVRALLGLVRPRDVRALSIRRASPPPRHREHGVLLSLGIHDIDLAACLMGAPLALASASSGGVGCQDEVRAELTLTAPAGGVARLVSDRGASYRERTVEVVTREEIFEGDLLVPRLSRRPLRGGPSADLALSGTEPLVAQARAIHAALQRRPADGPGPATGVDGARALALALDARASLLGVRPAPRRAG